MANCNEKKYSCLEVSVDEKQKSKHIIGLS